MKKQVMALVVVVVFLSGVVFNAVSRVNVDSNGNIVMQDPGAATPRYTDLYGSLWLFNTYTNNNVGWMYSNGLHTGFITATRDIVASGYISAVGNVYGANKYFVHPHPTDTTKVIKYITMESGEALTVARGIAKTANGQAIITLPKHFSMVTSKTEPVTVILTPIGAPAMLYTRQANRDEVVVAVKDGPGEIEFAYQVTGVRDGFENLEVIVDETRLYSSDIVPDSEKNEVQKRLAAYANRVRARQELERQESRRQELGYQGEPQNAAMAPAPVIEKDVAGISSEQVKSVQFPVPAPQSNQGNEAATAAPAKTLTAEFTAGPNPADRREGGVVNFYYQGQTIKSGQMTIYDAAGNVVNKSKIYDNAQGGQAKRQVGWWNLTDKKGRLVSEGTYLVKGTVTAWDGKKSVMSVMVGVR